LRAAPKSSSIPASAGAFPTLGSRPVFPLEQMGETAENVAQRYRVSREDQDAFALESHQRALAAQKAGKFEAELVAVEVAAKKGASPQRVSADEGPRADTSIEKLAQLKPVFREGGTVTAATAHRSTMARRCSCLVRPSEPRSWGSSRSRALSLRRAPASTRA